MSRFVGAHDYTIDGQGRLILPGSFREKVKDGAYITAIDNCLALLPTAEFEDMADKLEERVGRGELHVDAYREFTSRAAEVSPDSQGRIRIRPDHLEVAGIDRNVVVVGAGKRAEIWDQQRWESRGAVRSELLVDAIDKGFGVGSI